MWSVKYKTVSTIRETVKTSCKVCKTKDYQELVTEKKRLVVLYLVPITLRIERVKVCPVCRARMKVIESTDLIDSTI
jgi:hypothetical protein